MLDYLWLIPALPLGGFLVLALLGARLPRGLTAVVGAGSVGLAAVTASLAAYDFWVGEPPGHAYTQTLWVWLNTAGFSPTIAFYLDALSVVMMLVVTWVGFLIHLYSTEFMIDEEGYSRFFAYMNLFVSAMLTLVLADNLLLLYLGWEGVGLCSYLLIGFWYTKPENGYAARKAFVVTRVGDTAMAVGLFLLFTHLGTLQIQDVMTRAREVWPEGSTLPVAAALLLLGGAVGKSAQLPLQTWLPDAMAGPSPVSALIHAATMVTAGVYLIARTHVIFTLAPPVLTLVAVIGAATLLLAGFSGLTQRDIKRVLAYSTISQIGYMFLALGVGAWSAAIFHFMVHAFFKALLFLGAGSIILALDHEHDMYKMGGLRRQLPTTFWTFLIGSGALAAVPLVTAGFYSKDLIIWQSYASARGSVWLWAAALAGAFLTSLYTFRMVILTFFGPAGMQANRKPGWRMNLPMVVLAVLSLTAGFIELPRNLGNLPILSDFLTSTLPAAVITATREGRESLFGLISGCVSLGGILVIYLFLRTAPRFTEKLVQTPLGAALHRWWFAGWGFDALYNWTVVYPYIWLARINRNDGIDLFYRWIAWVNQMGYRALSATQTGRVRNYAVGLAIGAVFVVGLVVIL
ncbi:MAG: NADH-quinone oxidoreductase subunit L [Desulfobacterales bacterium]